VQEVGVQVQVRTITSPGHIRPQPAHLERIDLHAQGDATVKEQRREGPFERSFANISVAMPRILLEPASPVSLSHCAPHL
jgi:hypothetical protein